MSSNSHNIKFGFTHLLILIAVLIIAGCGGSGDQNGGAVMSADEIRAQDRQTITDLITEAITRWSYGDKAALYDLEFEYFWYEVSFEDYLTMRPINFLNADTVTGVSVENIEFFEGDSAEAKIELQFTGPSGHKSTVEDKYMLFKYNNKWYRPTLSLLNKQMEFDNIRRSADSAAAAEAEGEDW